MIAVVEYTATQAAKYIAGDNTYPKLEGYLFAGWYNNDTCNEDDVIAGGSPSGENAFALFIPEQVLSIQAQVYAELIDEDADNDEKSSMRFITSVDSLLYKQVGFEVYYTVNGVTRKATSVSNKVYSQLYETDLKTVWEKKPSDIFCDESKYFKICTLKNFTMATYMDTEFTVKPFWITMDDDKVYGVEATKKFSEGCIRKDVWVSDSGVDAPNRGGFAIPYQTLDYAIAHVVDGIDGGTIHIKDTYTVASNAKWENHNKNVIITGDNKTGTLDLSAIQMWYLKDDLTLKDMKIKFNPTKTRIFAEGNDFIVNSDVEFTNTTNIGVYGGGETSDVDSTNVQLYAGTYKMIYGGGQDGNVTGDTHVTVGVNVNPECQYTSHNYDYLLFGGCYAGNVGGDTYVTVQEGAKFNYVFGGCGNNVGNYAPTVSGTTNVRFAGESMAVYGGGRYGTNGDTNIVMTGGTVQQIFGGCEQNSMKGNTNIQILGGEVIRRVYGGCYNENLSDGRSVNGNTNVMVGPKGDISFTYSDDGEEVIRAISRYGSFENECGTFIFNENSNYISDMGWSGFGSPACHYLVKTNGNNAEDSYGNVSPAGKWLHIEPKENYVAKVTIGDAVKYYTEGEGYYPLPTLTDKTSQTEITVTFSEKTSTEAVQGDTKVAIISIADSAYGTVTSDKMYCLAGETITLSVTPDEGYNLVGLTVKKDGENVTLDKEISSSGGEYGFVPEEGTYMVEATFAEKEYGIVSGTIGGVTSGSITATETTTEEEFVFEDALYTDGSYGISLPTGTYKVYFDCGDTEGLIPTVTVRKNAVTEHNLEKTYQKVTLHKFGKDIDVPWLLTDNGQYTVEANATTDNTITMGCFDTVNLATTDFVMQTRVQANGTGDELIGLVLSGTLGDTIENAFLGRFDSARTARAYSLTYGWGVKQSAPSNSNASITDFVLKIVKQGNSLTYYVDSVQCAQWDLSKLEYVGSNGSSTTVSATCDYSSMTDAKIGFGLYRADKVIFSDYSYSSNLHTVSGTVSLGLAGAKTSDVTLTFANKADETITYTATPDANGKYSVKLPSADYKVTVSHANYVDNILECSVVSDDVTKDISLRKNKVHNEGTSFAKTEDGYYQSSAANSHNRFIDGYGSTWVANLELPNLAAGQGVGFVLVNSTNSSITWGKWMRILLEKAEDGTIQLHTQMHVDNQFDVGKTIDLSETSVEGKTLQVTLLNGNIVVTLDGSVIDEYDSSTKLQSGNETVGDVFGDLSETYCGLLANASGIVIKDWSFSNVLDASKKYTVSGTVSAGLAGVDVSNATLTFVNEADESKTYTVSPDADGKYSVQLPSGDYKVTASHANYLDNALECRVFYGDVTQDISLRRNKVDGTWAFTQTEDGNYTSNGNNRHSIFVNGYGNVWEAELEIPSLNAEQAAGFVLHMRKADGNPNWDSWMRILIKKTAEGNFQLIANILDNAFKIDTLSVTSVEGKILKVSLLNNRIVVMLEDKVLATYDSDTELETGKGTVGSALGMTGTNGVYCGPMVNTKDMEITNWKFTNALDTSEEYTVSGTVSAGVAGVEASAATLTFVNAVDETKTYTTTPDAEGKYSVQVPSGDYNMTVSHANYVDNTLKCRVMYGDVMKDVFLRKNKVHNEGTSFAVTEDGYISLAADKFNYFMGNGYGTVWEAELKVPNLGASQGIGFVLHQRKADGGINWDNWMQIILWQPATGNIQLQANILNKTYKTETLSVTSVEGKTLQVSLLNNRIVVSLDGEVIGTYDSSTVMENDIYTVDGVLGLSGTNGVYCGLVAKQADTEITDWNFKNVFEAETVCKTSLNYQGGAIYNNNAFVMNNNGTYRVIDLEAGTSSSEYTLDKADVIVPHANSVCFSDTFYPGDSKENGDYPLLYVNIYNNYRGQDEEHEGTCLVYRVQESEDGTISTTLVQVIVIGFAKSDVENIWKSAADIEQAGTTAVRPFGNFVVDTDNDMLYAYTLRSTEQCMRFFKFNLPEVQEVTEASTSDETYNATYGCYVVTLQESDIVNFKDDAQYFDIAGYPVIQDATYYQGKLILNDGSSAGTDSCIRVINPSTGKMELSFNVSSLYPDLVKEAEMISINPEDGSLYYMTTPGTLRKLEIPWDWE